MLPSSSSNNDSPPPPPNPLLTAFETWQQTTPFVTRSLLLCQVASYLMSWLFDVSLALATIPRYVLWRLELYRLVLSAPLVNTSLVSVILSFVAFSQHGRRLEQSLGSVVFAWTCFLIQLVTNGTFCLVQLMLAVVTSSSFQEAQGAPSLLASSSGLWTILFGLLALECVKAPRGMQQPFLFTTIPILYYPLALLFVFGLLSGGGGQLAHILSVVTGYTAGFGYLDRLGFGLSASTAQRWDDAALSVATTQLGGQSQPRGWISCTTALGSDAWQGGEQPQPRTSGFSLFGAGRRDASSEETTTTMTSEQPGAPRAGSVFRTGTKANDSNTSSFSNTAAATQGRTLGSGASSTTTTTRRATAAETRAARLQALERRQLPREGNDHKDDMIESA